MKILVTNDDGIHAEGIKAMIRALHEKDHEIVALAPDQERSACSHSITIHSPLRVRKVRDHVLQEGIYRVNGTPADCVKLGIRLFDDFEPDLIISGINNGKNLGYDVFYSGTVAGAVEAHLQGYKSIAVSLAIKKNRNFLSAARVTADLISRCKVFPENSSAPLNINIPDLPRNKIKGIKMTGLTPQIYDREVEERVDPAGRSYFWFVGGDNDIDYPDSDIIAVNNGYISLTPMKFSITDEDKKEKLQHLEDFDI